MITAADVQRWVQEAAPGLRGGYVHRIWRDEADAWVLLVRQHEGGDPAARAVARQALEVALPAEWARVVGLPPEAVAADDDKAKKTQQRDPHPFLAQLRRHLVGARVDDLVAVPGERIVWLDATHPTPPPSPDAQPRLRLIVELIGRQGNMILGARDEGGHVRCLAALTAGKAPRTFARGTLYQPPPPRPPKPDGSSAPDEEGPGLCPDVAPDPTRLTLGRAVAEVQREKAEAAVAASRHATYLRAARQALKRADGLVHKLEAQLAEVDRADELERQADLLKANLGKIPRGAAEARLTDYSTGEPVEVVLKLDPAQPVQDQMQALYKKARKLRSGEAAVRTRLGEVDANIAALQELAAEIEATSPDDEAALDALEKRLRKLGALPKESAPRPKVQVNQGPRSFRTREGHEVLVGRNDEENDRLTMRMARGNDLFFHVRGMPGSHVILRVDPNRPPNHESLLDAATLAVHWSKARNRGTAVDVSYTQRKWVKKPRGAKPGLVQISNEKTIRAGNDPERLERILSTGRREDGEGDDA